MMTTEKRLALAIIDFLKDQINSPSMTADAIESLEVGIQCMESAFEIIGQEETGYQNQIHGSKKLLEIFEDFEQTKQKKVTDEDKKLAEEYKNKGNDALKEENLTKALEHYNKAIDLNPNEPVYYCNRAATYMKLNETQKAISDCEIALKLNPNYGKAHARLGLAYISDGKYRKAKMAFGQALKCEPHNESYQNNLSFVEEKIREQGTNSESNMGSGDNTNTGGGRTTSNTNSGPSIPNLGNLFSGIFGGTTNANSNAQPGTHGGMDFSALLNNPALIGMATNLMSNPNIQNALSSMLGTSMNSTPQTNPSTTQPNASEQPTNHSASSNNPNMENFLRIGQNLASQIQNTHPDLINQLRSQMGNVMGSGTGNTANNNTPRTNPN